MTAPPARAASREAEATAGWLRASLAAGAALRSDSRAIGRGDAFFAYPGERSDGRRFIGQAIERGAAAIVWERDGFDGRTGWALPNRGVNGLKKLAGPIAAGFQGAPTEHMTVLAVTGTNGKTSCSQWIAHGLRHMGRDSAVIGTLGAGRLGALVDLGLTTPDALALQQCFADLRAAGVGHVAIEASSIGLEQARLDGTRIRVAVYTNLTRDHLDHHGTMQAYARAKARLFGWPGLAAAVVNLDDPWAGTMLADVAAGTMRIGYRIADGAAPPGGAAPAAAAPGSAPCEQVGAQVDRLLLARSVEVTPHGMRIGLDGDWGRASLDVPLLGRFNVSNLLAVAGAWLALGIGFEPVVAALQALRPVPGRLQAVPSAPGAPLVVVDYAHTPDALAQALGALRPVAQARAGRLWCLFGAGGDRDPGKRPLMGAVAEQLADRVVLTSDNPRSESPDVILAQIRAGMATAPHACDADRARAIRQAVAAAGAADVLLIAGKGHEPYQEIAGERLPFSDIEHAQQALRTQRGRSDA